MRAADTSVLVAAFATWHRGHASAVAALRAGDISPVEHALLETYSVLTRLPPPHRIAPAVAAEWIRERLGTEAIRPRPSAVASLPSIAASLDISGGAVYDALIGVSARDAGAHLLTRDRRASRTYDLLDVPHTVIRLAP